VDTFKFFSSFIIR